MNSNEIRIPRKYDWYEFFNRFFEYRIFAHTNTDITNTLNKIIIHNINCIRKNKIDDIIPDISSSYIGSFCDTLERYTTDKIKLDGFTYILYKNAILWVKPNIEDDNIYPINIECAELEFHDGNLDLTKPYINEIHKKSLELQLEFVNKKYEYSIEIGKIYQVMEIVNSCSGYDNKTRKSILKQSEDRLDYLNKLKEIEIENILKEINKLKSEGGDRVEN